MNDGILSGDDILRSARSGAIVIEPFNERQINPASYDLRLGTEVAVYQACVATGDDRGTVKGVRDGRYLMPSWTQVRGGLDVKDEAEVVRYKIPSIGWWLKPGIGYLMHTEERIRTDCFVPVLDGKSSIGRLFVQVHATAGYGDPGFDGQYTLEVTATHPVRVYAGMRFAQIRFHTLSSQSARLYEGNYTGEAARGAVPSRAWRQFAKNGG